MNWEKSYRHIYYKPFIFYYSKNYHYDQKSQPSNRKQIIWNKIFFISPKASNPKSHIYKKETLEKANKSLSIWEEKIFDKEYVKIDKAQ